MYPIFGADGFDQVYRQVEKSENPKVQVTPTPRSASLEKGSISNPLSTARDQVILRRDKWSGRLTVFQKETAPLKRKICWNYLHKRCSQDPCPYYHDPSLVSLPVLVQRVALSLRRPVFHPYASDCTMGPARRMYVAFTTRR